MNWVLMKQTGVVVLIHKGQLHTYTYMAVYMPKIIEILTTYISYRNTFINDINLIHIECLEIIYDLSFCDIDYSNGLC